MEAQAADKTLRPSQPPVERELRNRSPRCKTLGRAASEASDLAWAKTGAHVKGQLWWPARVLDRRDGRVHVSLLGEGHVGRSSWCNASQVKPFFNPNLAQTARQSDSEPFISSFHEALKFASKHLQSELTCNCIPLEARPMLNSDRSFELGLFNLAPLEFVNHAREAALNVSSANWEESVRLKSWVFALNQGFCNGNVGFCQRKLMDELVDKLDLDLDISMHEKEEVLKERDLAPRLQENGTNNGSSNSTGKNKKKKRESEKVLERESYSTSTTIKIEEQETVSSRRERKKSKYLSYPYTDLPQKTDSSYIMKLDLETPKEKKIEEKKNSNEGNFVNLESLSAREILSDLLCTGINPFYLKKKQSARAVQVFLEKYRDYTFIDGNSYESYKNYIFEQGNENVGSCSGSGSVPGQKRKPDFNIVNLKKCDRKIKEETDLMESDINNIPNLNKSDNNIPNLNKLDINIPNLSNKSNEKEKIDRDRPGPSLSVHFEKVITGCDGNNKRKKNNKSSGNKPDKNKANNTNNHASNGVVMLNFGEGSSEITEESRDRMVNNNLSQNWNNPVGISNQPSEQSKKRKKKNSQNNTTGITIPKKRGPKKKVIPEQQSYPNPAALLLEFTNPNPNIKPEPGTSSSSGTGTGTALPSRELLLSTFSKFGSLVETETELHRDSCTARVVFARSTDAEVAYNSSDKLGPFGPPFASCRLHYLPPIAPTPPPAQQQLPGQQKVVKAPLLIDIRKNLEMIDIRKNLEMMISSLKSGSGPGLVKVENNGSDVTRPDMRENLMGEMQGLLIKVEKLLANGATAGTSVMPPP